MSWRCCGGSLWRLMRESRSFLFEMVQIQKLGLYCEWRWYQSMHSLKRGNGLIFILTRYGNRGECFDLTGALGRVAAVFSFKEIFSRIYKLALSHRESTPSNPKPCFTFKLQNYTIIRQNSPSVSKRTKRGTQLAKHRTAFTNLKCPALHSRLPAPPRGHY